MLPSKSFIFFRHETIFPPFIPAAARCALATILTFAAAPEVELPAGEHMVRVDIKDTDGRVGTSIFMLKVAP